MLAADKLGYGDVLDNVKAAFPSVTVDVPQSGGSAASDGADVSGSGSVSSAASGRPTVVSSPGSASGVGPQRSAVDASTDEGQGVGVDSPPVAGTANQGAAVTPASPMPGVAPVSQPSGQSASLSGGVASPSNRVNPQGQQGAPEEAVPAGDGEDIEAGSGTPAAERAPIDVAAARPQQAPAPAPAPAP